MSRCYFRYWGKAMPGNEGAQCHLLPYHCLDVAAVGHELLLARPRWINRWSETLSIAPSQLSTLLVFMLGIHDIGKFSRSFQQLAAPQGADLVPTTTRDYVRHDSLGAVLANESLQRWYENGALNMPALEVSCERRIFRTLKWVLGIFFGHHGVPVTASYTSMKDYFLDFGNVDDCDAAEEFLAAWMQVLNPEWPLEQLADKDWLKLFKNASWEIIGWVTLSDWLGSDQSIFKYCDQPMELDRYWHEIALPRARESLRSAGFSTVVSSSPYQGISQWFGSEEIVPTPLQQRMENIPIGNGPQLFILEDVTGAGKTEAACILAQRLLNTGRYHGLYFALPTMATSNAMYHRLGKLHRYFFSADSQPSIVLAHGAREMNDAFVNSLSVAPPDEKDYSEAEQDMAASTYCNRWLGDSRKKSLLADVGIGTIDQALMAVLPLRHQCLRVLGLAGKVLIIDEVHAYDMYMQHLLAELLSYHARNGGSVILLTATLPKAMRKTLVEAWQAGQDIQPDTLQCTDFPLVTAINSGQLSELPVDPREESRRRVEVGWLTHPDAAMEKILAAVEKGQSVVWVRNTVNDAIASFSALKERHPMPEKCLLFHARFAMIDRQRIETSVLERLGKHSTPNQRRGQVIISSQVLQESLDCDSDLMVSDIAPIDLIIQRVGRLQRHLRGEREAPFLWVLAPEWNSAPGADWLKKVLPGTQAVYGDTNLIWNTQRILRQQKHIAMPDDARLLIESVYGESAKQPEGLVDIAGEAWAIGCRDRSMARSNRLALEEGYSLKTQRAWAEEHRDTSTRLSDEVSLDITLLRCEGDQLVLLASKERQAVMMSQLRLRQGLVDKLASLPSRFTGQWETLQKQHPTLKWSHPWLPELDPNNSYDGVLGAVIG